MSSYVYDSVGRRVKRIRGGVGVWQIYAIAGEMLAEYREGAPEANGTRYLTEDSLGTPRVITDSSGAVKGARSALPHPAAYAAPFDSVLPYK